MEPTVLSIAGFDPSTGAGITADVKTAASHGCYALTCITAVTVQSTRGVRKVVPLDPQTVSETLADLVSDLPPDAVRLGMLGSAQVAAAVADFLESNRLSNVVVDPVLRSSSGAELLDPSGLEILRYRILPLADVVTPNLAEAAVLTGLSVEDPDQMRQAGRALLELGSKNAVVTGGHLAGPEMIDVLVWRPGGSMEIFEEELGGERIDSNSTHGTGCAFAMSIACHLARGFRLPDAVAGAKNFVAEAIRNASPMGNGKGPMDLLWPMKSK